MGAVLDASTRKLCVGACGVHHLLHLVHGRCLMIEAEQFAKAAAYVGVNNVAASAPTLGLAPAHSEARRAAARPVRAPVPKVCEFPQNPFFAAKNRRSRSRRAAQRCERQHESSIYLLIHAAAADWWSLVDNTLRVTDELIAAPFWTSPAAWMERWMARGRQSAVLPARY